jgi:hypothetical protein
MYVTSAPTWPLTSTSGAEMKSFSAWTSGSLSERPAMREKDETVFLRLETSWFFAASPMYLLLGPKPTSELWQVSTNFSPWEAVWATYGVARLETSFVICRGLAWGTVQERHAGACTYHVNTAIARNGNDGVERPQVHAHDRHVYR